MKIGDRIVVPLHVATIGGEIATIVRIEDNSFVGKVVTVQTKDGTKYFDKEYQFQPVEACTR
jgi:preprotein translocase subunit YajC